MSQKVTVTVRGKKRTFTSITEAAKAAKMGYTTFYMRYMKSSATEAFKTPVRKYKPREQVSA